MEQGENSKPSESKALVLVEHYAYDTRTDRVFSFRRMKGYVLLKLSPLGTLFKISNEEFDEYFEGTPPPSGTLIERVK